MTTIQLDEQALAALKTTDTVVAVTDAAGAVIGYYASVKQEYARDFAELAAKDSAANLAGERPLTTAQLAAKLQAMGAE